ncbi:MAG: hypothetical protein JKX97_09095, partial [Candidatus Lindowbacteria bacterium]|nr:hypothetical protein [Candidatus Lindowbacteria bacterium]
MEIAEQKKNLWMTRLRFFFGALLLAILISMLVKAGQFSELLGRLQFGQIVVVIGLTTIYMLIGGINIGVLLGSGVTKTIEVTRAYLLSWCVSLVMPSKSGDLTIIYYLNQEGFSKEEAASVFTLDKLVSLVVYAAVPIMFLDSGTVLYDVSVMIVVLNAVVVAGALLSTVLVSKMTSPYKIILVAAKVSAGCTELLVRRAFAVAAN